MSAPVTTGPRHPAALRLVPGGRAAAALRVVERNALAWRGLLLLFVSMLVEPAFFLLSIGVGVGALVGDVTLPTGTVVPYRVFVGAGMLASSAMFGPVYDAAFGFFVKLKYGKLYDGMLATPLEPVDIVRGELAWSVLRGAVYALFFLGAMIGLGLVRSWWAVLAVPVAALVAFAFAATALAASTWLRSYVDFDWIHLALVPQFLFATIFFPLSRYPTVLQWVVRLTPLYQGVVLERALVLGELSWSAIFPVLYLLVMGCAGLAVAGRRARAMLQP